MCNTNKIDNLYKEAFDLESNSRIVKNAHFHAAQCKQKTHRILGIIIVVINVIIFSPLISLIFPNSPETSVIVVKFSAIIGASLAGVQTLFNFQKEAELHLSAGELYAKIYHQTGTLLAKYKDSIVDSIKFIEEFESLQQEYLKANNNYKSCIPSNKDYKSAEKLIKLKSGN